MLTCPGCHRHARVNEARCPFCAAPLHSAMAPAPFAPLALAVSLSLLGCSDDDDGETAATTPGTSTSDGMTLGESESESNTQETEDWGGSDYGGPPPSCDNYMSEALELGANAIDTSEGVSNVYSTCGALQGEGPDALLRFVAPSEGAYTISLTVDTEAWIVEADSYSCYAINQLDCSLPQAPLVIELEAEEMLYLWLDGTEGASATVDIVL